MSFAREGQKAIKVLEFGTGINRQSGDNGGVRHGEIVARILRSQQVDVGIGARRQPSLPRPPVLEMESIDSRRTILAGVKNLGASPEAFGGTGAVRSVTIHGRHGGRPSSNKAEASFGVS